LRSRQNDLVSLDALEDHVVVDQIPIAFMGVKFDGEAVHVSRCIRQG
jgi:hypothetical protein